MPIDSSSVQEAQQQQLVNLCEDTIREILARLPVRTLIRFKQAGKRFFVMHERTPWYWRSRPSDLSTSSISIVDRYCIIHEQDIRMPLAWARLIDLFIFSSLRILSAGFGLYCLFNFPSLRVALWNPATAEIKDLPQLPFTEASGYYNYVFGFVHAQFNNEDAELSYKVGIICSDPYKHNFSYLHLYSSVTNAWKLLICDDIVYAQSTRNDQVNFKGKLHILSGSLLGPHAPCIFTFDCANEQFGRAIEVLPDASSLERYRIDLSVLTLYDDKYLCLVMFGKCELAQEDDKFFDVWIMREYGVRESWSKIGPTVSYKGKYLHPRSCTMGEIFFTEYDPVAALHRLWVYNCTSGSSQLTQLPISTQVARPFMCVLKHTESLVTICKTPLASLHRWIIQDITTVNLHNSLPPEIQSLPPSFSDLSLLRDLDLSSNSLRVLPQSLGSLRHLKTLNVDHNSLNSLPQTLGWLSCLKFLSVAHNNINQLTFTAQAMVGLQHLCASHNLLEHISNEVCWAPSLLSMDLSYNPHLRALPYAIGYIGTLLDLNISRTAIEDLPATFSRLTFLQSFRASGTGGISQMMREK